MHPLRSVPWRWAVLAGLLSSSALAGPPRDTAGIGNRTGRWPIDLLPTTRPSLARPGGLALQNRTVALGKWTYQVERNPAPRDSVPWILHAFPAAEPVTRWRPAAEFVPTNRVDAIPVVRIPQQVWKGWVDSSMQDVVGIHFHELTSDDIARVLITVHKFPADSDDGQPPAALNVAAGPIARGTRLEATLMTPLAYALDQAVLVRIDPQNDAQTAERATHEKGHALRSLGAMLQVLAGPQTWNPRARTGRRSTLTWYWQSEKFSRPWEGYRNARADLSTLRTTIALAPPTRWSKLLPTPPENLTQAEIDRFHDEVIDLAAQFTTIDQAVQEDFHRKSGAYQAAPSP